MVIETYDLNGLYFAYCPIFLIWESFILAAVDGWCQVDLDKTCILLLAILFQCIYETYLVLEFCWHQTLKTKIKSSISLIVIFRMLFRLTVQHIFLVPSESLLDKQNQPWVSNVIMYRIYYISDSYYECKVYVFFKTNLYRRAVFLVLFFFSGDVIIAFFVHF